MKYSFSGGIFISAIITITILHGCESLKRYHYIIKQKDEFNWIGRNGNDVYKLEVLTVRDEIWFTALLHKQSTDSNQAFYLSGFEKGIAIRQTLGSN
jgi:hypothetical protein